MKKNRSSQSPIPQMSIRGVCKSFGRQVVLDHLDLDIQAGSSLVIMGGSGTGKSVLLKSILGLLPIDEGEIYFHDASGKSQPVTGLSGRSYETYLENFGMLFQGSALFDSLPVWENVTFGIRRKHKIKKSQAVEMAIESLASVGLQPDVAFIYPAELSGGMQRRVAIARATIARPPIIFFDEPTAGLDPIVSSIINELIVQCSQSLGATSVTITHDIKSARHIAQHVAMIHDGRIIWQGSAKDMDHSDNPYVDQFIHGKTQGPIKLPLNQ